MRFTTATALATLAVVSTVSAVPAGSPGATESSYIAIPTSSLYMGASATSSHIGASVTSSHIGASVTSSFLGTPTVTTASASSTPSGPSDIDCITAGKYIGWYRGAIRAEAIPLWHDCMDKTADTIYMWSKTSCVALATSAGIDYPNTSERCRNHAFPTEENLPHLSYNVYANIVGECAWQDGGCPITKQKYIDWFYGALSAVNTNVWPPNSEYVVENYWQPILDWTKTGDVLPYKNFDDWLHYSHAH